MTEFGAAASSSSSSVSKWPYHVFLSFRGEDTRYGFTGNLYHALCGRGIRTFIDDEGIRKGEEITPTLLKKIKESKTAIVVFSKGYASSTFCLTELAHILDCMKGHNGRFIWPVFYDVDPSDIRHQTGSYKEAFDRYEGVKDETMVKRWKLALTEAANMSGWPFDPRSELYQYKIIDEIVQEVSKVTRIGFLHVARFPVGLQPRVEAVCSLLNKEPHCDGATIVGIFGVGGIGKSTIARATYNELGDNFKHKCFLNDIKERSICEVQGRLLSEILGEKDINLKDYNFGISVIRDKLCDKKVLLVLDDISNQEQLGALAGESNWFGSGSKIIITTRNRSLLQNHDVKGFYGVPELSDREARQLLILNAFKKEEEDPEYKEVINRAVKYGFGLPLALETFGSTFGPHRTVKEMESFLDMQEKFPNKTVQQSLKVSYDSLEELEKDIFLDIACFHRGFPSGYATDIMSATYGSGVDFCINMLIDKSLIKIDEIGRFNMHDLIQDMGREIVRQESPWDVGARSRLWSSKDILHVLNENTGTATIQAMTCSFNFSYEMLEWSGEAFEKMKILRVLSFSGGLEFSQGPKCLPNSLRVVEWACYPSSTLPDNFCPINLVVLRLIGSHLKTLGKACKNFYSLRTLDLKHSLNLEEVPEISGAVNLEELNVSHCPNLTKISDSVGHLIKLKVLNADGCNKLDTFIVGGIKLISLEILNVSNCSNLHTFPEILARMEKVKTLDLSYTVIKTLPESIEKLVALERISLRRSEERSWLSNFEDFCGLNLNGCKQLQEIRKLPPNIEVFFADNCKFLTSSSIWALGKQNFPNLGQLNLSGCENLEELPDISGAVSLEVLDVSYCDKLTKIDDSVGCLVKLRVLNAKGCFSLDTFIVKGIELVSLEVLNLRYCSNLHIFPEILVPMKKIKTLDLSDTGIKTLPESIEKLVALERLSDWDREFCEPKLKTLYLAGCVQLQEIRKIPPNIKVFSFDNFNSLTFSYINALLQQNFFNLVELDLRGSENLEELPDISEAVNLEKLDISYCKKLTKIDDSVGCLSKLRVLNAEACYRLDTFIVGGINMVSIEILNLKECSNLHTFPEILKNVQGFKTLNLSQTAIKTLPKSIEKLTALKALYLNGCKELRQLPNLACPSLKTLELDECKGLEEIRGIPPNIKVFSARNCTSLTFCSTRLLLTQELHETRNIKFIMPGNEIPKWLHKHSTGGSVCFWVRRKFPQIALCAVVTGGPTIFSSFVMHINGVTEYKVGCDRIEIEIDHIFLFDLRHFEKKVEDPIMGPWMRVRDFRIDVASELLAKEWNHVKFSLNVYFPSKDPGTKSRLKYMGVFVYNYDSCKEDILFENPIPQERIQVEAVHKIGDSNLVSSSRDNNEEDLLQQQQQHLTSINQQIPESSEIIKKAKGKDIVVCEGNTNEKKGGNTLENHRISSNSESLNWDPVTWEHQLKGQKDQSTIIDKVYDGRASHYSKDLAQQQHLTSIHQQIPKCSENVKKAKGKDIMVYGGNSNEKQCSNALEGQLKEVFHRQTKQEELHLANDEILTQVLDQRMEYVQDKNYEVRTSSLRERLTKSLLNTFKNKRKKYMKRLL